MTQLVEQWAEAAEKASLAMEREVDTRPRSQAGQDRALQALRTLGPSNVVRLSSSLNEPGNTIRWWLSRLETRGLVARVKVPRKGGPPRLMWKAVEGGPDAR